MQCKIKMQWIGRETTIVPLWNNIDSSNWKIECRCSRAFTKQIRIQLEMRRETDYRSHRLRSISATSVVLICIRDNITNDIIAMIERLDSALPKGRSAVSPARVDYLVLHLKQVPLGAYLFAHIHRQFAPIRRDTSVRIITSHLMSQKYAQYGRRFGN